MTELEAPKSIDSKNLKRPHSIAAGWGFAEATVFFIVPDVVLSWYALKSVRLGLIACIYAVGGALIGGTLIWFLGTTNPDMMRAFFASLPAIDSAMIADVRTQLEASGVSALFLGPLAGVPYKIYALEAGNLGYGLGLFLLISIPARFARFVLVTAIAAGISQLLRKRLSMVAVRTIHVLCWTVFYAWFIWFMSTR